MRKGTRERALQERKERMKERSNGDVEAPGRGIEEKGGLRCVMPLMVHRGPLLPFSPFFFFFNNTSKLYLYNFNSSVTIFLKVNKENT